MHDGIFPRDCRTRLHLRPGDLRVPPQALAALRHEVVDSALAVLVSRIPVLHRRVADLRVVQRHQLNHRRMQLILISHRSRAAFEVAYVRALFSHNQRPLKLTRFRRVDAEVRRQFHRTAHSLRHIHKRPIAEHRRVQGSIEIVRVRHNRSEILLHQVRMLLHRFGKRAEDHARFGQLCLERRCNRHRVEDRIHGYIGKQLLLGQRNPQLLVRAQNLRVYLVEAGQLLLLLRRRVVRDVLVVNWRKLHVGPLWLRVRPLLARPVAVRAQTPFQHELRLVLLRGDQPDHVLAQPLRNTVFLNVGDKAPLVFLTRQLVDDIHISAHASLPNPLSALDRISARLAYWLFGRSRAARPGTPPRPNIRLKQSYISVPRLPRAFNPPKTTPLSIDIRMRPHPATLHQKGPRKPLIWFGNS